MVQCDRYWLLTWTTYGTWLPGDRRGFVSPVRGTDGRQVIHNVVGTAFDRDLPAVRGAAQQKLRGPPILLDQYHAEVLAKQLIAHAAFRQHALQAAAFMANHCHIVIGVPGDPDPSRLLGDYKSYLSRALNQQFDRPAGGSWWTQSGSKRKVWLQGVRTVAEYVRRQHAPLLVWIAPHWEAD